MYVYCTCIKCVHLYYDYVHITGIIVCERVLCVYVCVCVCVHACVCVCVHKCQL